MTALKSIFPLVINLLLFLYTPAQQVPDTAYTFPIRQPAYRYAMGPVILIDQAHHNFHTKDGGFRGFSKLMDLDGYRVQSLTKPVRNQDVLKNCSILVISNALDSSNVDEWSLPTPSAFTDEEIAEIRHWVKSGGSLLLIADHLPFAGAAYKLAKAFGFEFLNGFAMTGATFWPPSIFSLKNKMLGISPAVTGIKEYEKIDSVATFTGSAFRMRGRAIPVLNFLPGQRSLQPDTAWRFSSKTPSQDLDGFHQGAILRYRKGRVAVFGEAAMFTAQLVNGSVKIGLGSSYAPQNAQFVLNLVHWLNGVKEYSGAIKVR